MASWKEWKLAIEALGVNDDTTISYLLLDEGAEPEDLEVSNEGRKGVAIEAIESC